MSTQAVLALDLLTTILVAGAWIAAAAVVCAGGSRLRANGVLTAALVLTAIRVALAVVLAGRSWPLAQEKVLLSLPLLVIPALAVIVLWRRHSAVPVIAAACGATAGILVAFVIGYPATPLNIAILVAITVAVFLLLIGRFRRTSVAVLAGALVLGPGMAAVGRAPQPTAGTDVAQIRFAGDTAPVKAFELTAARLRPEKWAFNGQVPGPELRVVKGDIVEVLLRNTDIEDGVTIHWHGYPVPNGDDGVAGVTQEAVMPGGQFRYRFRANKAGTFWYHTHQISHRGVKLGLFGTLIVEDARGSGLDLTVVQHRLVTESTQRDVPAGTPVRLRLINADDVSHTFAVTGVPWQLSAVDGTDINAPEPITDRSLRLAAGGRYDVKFTMPDQPVTLFADGAPRLALSGPAVEVVPAAPELDLLAYGRPVAPAPNTFDRDYTVVLDRQLRLLGLMPSYAYTVNGRVWPRAPALTVRQGDWVKLTVVNRDRESHPMHPHGHQVLVSSRDGVAVRGSPLWMDSFEARPGEIWEVALLADNPGIWMAHCHNLPHAAKGMMLHLHYEGHGSVHRPGGHNHPE